MSNRNNNQIDDLLTNVQTFIQQHDGTIAIGLDMAASQDNWGICILAVSADNATSTFIFLLPQAKINKDNSLSPTLICRPNYQVLKQVLKFIQEKELNCSMGVDVPLGWPTEHTRFLNAWSAQDGWKSGDAVPDRKNFERRLCDRKLNEFNSSIAPLAVGGDTIAQAAFKWATCLNDLSTLAGDIDLGLQENGRKPINTFETYPAAFLRLVFPKCSDYKSKPSVRTELLSLIKASYPFTCGELEETWINWAINQKGSPDAFDAFLCAVTAWDHLRWRHDPRAISLTTPELLLGHKPTDEERNRILREGWILVSTGGPPSRPVNND